MNIDSDIFLSLAEQEIGNIAGLGSADEGPRTETSCTVAYLLLC